MSLRDENQKGKFQPGDPRLGQTIGPISSLNEAWIHTLDSCVIDSPLSEVILPLMRNCFFGGAMHAVFLLQKGHGDQLASDIAGFIKEEPQP
jgi:hypothetical protein